MIAVHCIGMFCEDIREEKNGALTLIGVMPDNAHTEVVAIDDKGEARPGPHITMIPKICIYLRMNFDPDYDLPEATIRLVPSLGEPIELGKIEREIISKARTEAKKKGNLLAGLITRGVLGNFTFPREGSLRLEVAFPNETVLAGAMYFKPQALEAISSTG